MQGLAQLCQAFIGQGNRAAAIKAVAILSGAKFQEVLGEFLVTIGALIADTKFHNDTPPEKM